VSKIRSLREDVFHKIAAGEVIERPLSAVKELVENAIDAGAGAIRIAVWNGGKSLIKVDDDGEGFADEDVEVAFQRHSTSKLVELSDFDHLRTLGFRGEALPSILTVADVTLKTADNDSGNGSRYVFQEGKVLSRSAAACQRGTSVEVRNLFHNFPVRRKFLKSDQAELNQISAFVDQISLAYPAIAFSLSSNNRLLADYSKTDKAEERIYQVFGREFLDDLQAVCQAGDKLQIEGFISRPGKGLPVKNRQFFFVNRRPVREKTLLSSFQAAFAPFLEKGRFPAGILWLNVDPAEIDVNIHPMKLEVRFRDSSLIYLFIKELVERAMQPTSGAATIPPGASESPLPPAAESPARGALFPDHQAPRDDFQLIGQYRDSYILIERNERLLIVDQHNAQERVIFDRLRKAIRGSEKVAVPAAAPLFPLIIDLSPSEKSQLDEARQHFLSRAGFEIAWHSGDALEVKAFPQSVSESNLRDALLAVIHLPSVEVDFEEHALAEIACHSAVKVNRRLFPEEMRALVRELWQTSNPFLCPHRRPIVIELTPEEIEKRLRRR